MEKNNTPNTNTRRDVIIALLLFILVLTGGITFYHYVENLRWVDAAYFTSVTLTTVGYGDFAPQTDIGKLFTAAYAFIGIGMFFGLAGILFHGALARSKERRLHKESETKHIQ